MNVDDIVNVGPNTAAFHGAPHFEPMWKGRIVRITEFFVDVEPLDGKLTRNVLKNRIFPAS